MNYTTNCIIASLKCDTDSNDPTLPFIHIKFCVGGRSNMLIFVRSGETH